MAGTSVESFYGAAARSMSESWHDFIFGAFDPAGTVTVDKLPGALWAQALSLRIFGFHIWALVLPQVVEGVLTVLVLYRAVRRLAGPAAGLTAAAVLAVTPITVLLSRGNVSDSLLILLLVLAADATSAALLTGSLRELLLAGVWVGLAFQAKMIQAVVALVMAAAAAAQLLLPASGQGGHLTAAAFAGAAVLLLPAAASVSCVIRGLGPFDSPFESSKTAHNSQALAAAAPALTRAVQRLELQTPPGDALFGTDTSGLAQSYILYSGREVLPIGGYLGNVPAPTLATLQADISRATCAHSCCRCHRRARTRGCGGSSRTAPGSPRPRTAARSRTRPSSADPAPAGSRPPRRRARSAARRPRPRPEAPSLGLQPV